MVGISGQVNIENKILLIDSTTPIAMKKPFQAETTFVFFNIKIKSFFFL